MSSLFLSVLNLLAITSKFHQSNYFVIFDVETVFRTEVIGIFIINQSICLNYRLVIKFKCSNKMELRVISCSCRSSIEVFNEITHIHQSRSYRLIQIGFIQISLFTHSFN